jgi:hypothetical protein
MTNTSQNAGSTTAKSLLNLVTIRKQVSIEEQNELNRGDDD